MSNKNYTNRTSCNQHEDCLENEYCDQFGYCWWCNEYDTYCDSIDGHCPTYCSEHGMVDNCPECRTSVGDVNQDGVVNIQDVILMIGAILGDTTLNTEQFHAADVNGDGFVNVVDVVAIINLLVSRGEISREQGETMKNRLKYDVKNQRFAVTNNKMVT